MLVELVCPHCEIVLILKSKEPTIVCRRCGQTIEVPPGALARVDVEATTAYLAAVAKARAAPPPPPPEKLFGLTFSEGLVSSTGVKGKGKGVRTGPGKEGKAIFMADEATLYYPSKNHILAERGCIEFWLRINWPGDDNRDYVFFEIGTEFHNRMTIFKDAANNFRFVVWGPDSERGVHENVAHWQKGEWHHIRANWYQNKIDLYLDGVKGSFGSRSKASMPARLAPYFSIGSDAKGAQQADAVIDEFAIYSSPVETGR